MSYRKGRVYGGESTCFGTSSSGVTWISRGNVSVQPMRVCVRGRECVRECESGCVRGRVRGCVRGSVRWCERGGDCGCGIACFG